MKNGLQYPVSSAICYLVDYPLSSVKCSVGQCFWSTGQDKDLLVFFCVPEVAYHIHPLLYTQTYTGLSYTPTHTLGCPIHPHILWAVLFTHIITEGSCPIHPHLYWAALYTHNILEVSCPINPHIHCLRDGMSQKPTPF